jgi:gamma-glutamyl:cysteine ligase YbdK (ATP-grasp superfamily)
VATLKLFEGYGIELEYMMVHSQTLVPLPISDQVLNAMAGGPVMNVTCGEIAWSNELAMHVIEMKSHGPKADLQSLHQHMQTAINEMNKRLTAYDAKLLPTAMHPFFAPDDGTLKLWDHEDSEIYGAYDRIFSCKGHGWGNLQSIHINLPFDGDEEFGRLHAAVRMILPLLPAIAASSPLVEGKPGPLADSRLHYYLANQRKIASIIGDAIPEAVRSHQDYQEKILQPMYRDIAPFDPDGDLQHEWLNSRAAIARFDRNAIEIRILDIQECLTADFAIISAVASALQRLCKVENFEQQFQISQATLKQVLQGALQEGPGYKITDPAYLQALGTKQDTIGAIIGEWLPESSPYHAALRVMTDGHNLSRRIMAACGASPTREAITKVYQSLAECLAKDSMYDH